MSELENQVPEEALSLGAVATAVRYIEVSKVHTTSMKPRIGSQLAPFAPLFQPVELTNSIRAYELTDVVLDADTLMLLHDGRPLPDTAFLLPSTVSSALKLRPESLVRHPEGEDVILGCNTYYQQYLCWLTHCLPAIDWLLRKPRTRLARLVLPPLLPWQEEFLALLGHHSVPRLLPAAGKQYRLGHAEYADFLCGGSYGVSMSLQETIRRIRDRVPPHGSTHRILYVHCNDTYYGRITNAAEVRDLLASHGVCVVEQDRTRVAERINLFRQADVVIGAHSAELADVLFCNPGALVWEWTARHCASPVVNWFAQAVGMDYWGDLLDADPDQSAEMRFDLDILQRGLAELSRRPTSGAAVGAGRHDHPPASREARDEKPIDELMLAFESLGDNCEFGFVQRYARAEPLGLLRFASIRAVNTMVGLVAALRAEFVGLGDPDRLIVEVIGGKGHREYDVYDPLYHLHYHTGLKEGAIEQAVLLQSQARQLAFKRRKLLEDLRSGAKIWVWKSPQQTAVEHLQPLRDVLRGFGPNVLMWVVEADTLHPPGTVERLADDLIKGYVERFAPYDDALNISPLSWIQVCRAASALCHPEEPQPERLQLIEPEAPPPPTAMDYLARHTADIPPAASSTNRKGLLAGLRRLLGPRSGR